MNQGSSIDATALGNLKGESAPKITLATPNSVSLPEGAIRRAAARPQHLQDPTYAEKYDDSTLFYDIVLVGEDVVLSGPPLLNLEEHVRSATVTIDGEVAIFEKTEALERSQITIFSLPSPPENSTVSFTLRIESLGLFVESEIDISSYEILKDSKVLMTLQKNEELAWIRDWAQFYVKNHGVNAVIIYDNGSDRYSPQDIAKAVASIDGIGHVVVVDWGFKYGPQGSPWVGPGVAWDSDFCQIGAFQNCRYKWTTKAVGWINCDVDELIVPLKKRTIFDELEHSSSGVVGVGGRWISNIAVDLQEGQLPRYWNFPYFTAQECNAKWVMASDRVKPSAHPTAHYVRGVGECKSSDFMLAHFKPLNSGWKIPTRREVSREVRRSPLTRDESHLLKAVRYAFEDVGVQEASDLALTRSLSTVGIKYDASDAPMVSWLFNALRTSSELHNVWHKCWLWRSKVFVLEYPGESSDIAFDIVQRESTLVMSCGVRNKAEAVRFKESLQSTFGAELGAPKPSQLGYEVLELGCSERWDDALALAERIIMQVMEMEPLQAGVVSLQRKLNKWPRTRYPLKNLRSAPEYKELADKIKTRSNGDWVLYVPNMGNWEDALIHKGTEQFLKHFGIDFKTIQWKELQPYLRESERLGLRVGEKAVLNGGGGSWRASTSGNRSRAQAMAGVFGNIIELPHSYATSMIDQSGCEIDYFARDRSGSLEHVPSASFCHDIAFFLQLPSLTRVDGALGEGFFFRGDKERSSALGDLYRGTLDLSKFGNHMDSITPFFEILSRYSCIYTDRMHIAIAGAMMGKDVRFYIGNHGESLGVYEATLKTHYPNVKIIDLI
ncbi:hypothetical protein [Corynebacterium sp. MC3]|uniref:hypothetical protein n=1 Tax=Corynebacterium sp. MC3 TaxID=1720193 RepID=UPI0008D8F9ED|nr:hypothetical protein [Corynebacterium sp. MC3]